MLKQHKIQTKTSKVDRVLFPSLIKQLYQTATKSEYLHLGFRAADIYPLTDKAIPDWKIASSLPTTTDEVPEETTSEQAQQETTKGKSRRSVTRPCTVSMSVNIIHKGQKMTLQDMQSTPK